MHYIRVYADLEDSLISDFFISTPKHSNNQPRISLFIYTSMVPLFLESRNTNWLEIFLKLLAHLSVISSQYFP